MKKGRPVIARASTLAANSAVAKPYENDDVIFARVEHVLRTAAEELAAARADFEASHPRLIRQPLGSGVAKIEDWFADLAARVAYLRSQLPKEKQQLPKEKQQ